ncbi:MAG: DUF5305 family protein [Clostridiaceae bacterium]|nr:DUF5305 family protein [Clostridiaceae bacterium]
MKQNARTALIPNQTKKAASSHRSHLKRYGMHRIPRRLLILILSILLTASLFAGYTAWRPIAFSYNTNVLRADSSSAIDYLVYLKDNPFSKQETLGMDQVYLDDLTQAVKPTFTYRLQIDRPADLDASYQIDAVVRVRDAANPATVLLEKPVSVLPAQSEQIKNGQDWQLSRTIQLDMDEYRALADLFAGQSSVAVTYDLAVTLKVQVIAQLSTGPVVFTGSPTLIIPVNQPQFQITRQLITPAGGFQPIRQVLRYQLSLKAIPLPFFAGAAALCLLSLVVLLTTTRSRPKDHFKKNLRRMLRQARGRLMLIGDKAWEPEWCIAATNFRAMVRTAKKLKHPIFCYIDRMAAFPVAYFYVYYGENNYCYAYTEHPEALHAKDETKVDPGASAEPAEAIPVLPEADETPSQPDADASPEILLANLRYQMEHVR